MLLLTGTLTACFSFGSKDDETVHYYVIDTDRGTVAANFAKNRVLRLKPIRVTSHFRNKNIMFKVGDNEFQPQEMHEFLSSPDEMITTQLRRWLQKTGLFSLVIVDDNQPADMDLEVAVTALYGEAREQFSPQASLEMQFFLTSADSESSNVLFQTGLRVDTDIEKATPALTVKGWNIGLKELLLTLEDDFSGYFSKRSPQ
ncbi:PqiC family protein [Pseudomonadota bacterium]|nr:PqiC family protein [Pseudomonadota bacterium]